jgi:exodeoxyribonuclease V alpha subunit
VLNGVGARAVHSGTLSGTNTDEGLVSIEGSLGHVVFRDGETGFTIARFDRDERAIPVTVKGLLPGVHKGERLRILGRWHEDARYGRQLRIESFLPLSPDTPEALVRHLGGASVRGIGKHFARRLHDHFGDQLMEVLDNQPQRLREVPGIGPKRVRTIVASWRESRAQRDAYLFLQGLGLGQAQSGRVLRRYKEQTVRQIRENPYLLATEVSGIGFSTADRVARGLGIVVESPHRLRAGVLHALGVSVDQGHCYLPRSDLRERVEALLGVGWPLVAPQLDDLAAERAVVREPGPAEERIWLRELHSDEELAGERLVEVARASASALELDVPAALAWAQRRGGLTLTPAQRDALARALTGKVVVITGGPGTGKTTLVRALLDIWERKGLRVQLAAPTGRAARRMEEASGRKASTLHRLLEFSPKEGRFLRGLDNPLRCDALVVDEASMVDVSLARSTFDGLPTEARLVLVGDVDQLPSVGPGSVLADVIRSRAVPVVTLDVVFRQEEAGLIVNNAHRILRGQLPLSAEQPTGDFFVIPRDDPEVAARTVVHLVTERIPARWGLKAGTDIQVLVPMRKGTCGTEALNVALRQALNPQTDPGLAETLRPLVGDRVMQITNDYDKDVFNGDCGWAVGPGAEGRGLTVRFDDGRELSYAVDELDSLRTAYAMTVHKSQGSEYPAVVVPLLTQHFRLLQRNLLYTAITRGKRLVVLVGSRKAVEIALANADTQHRYTALAERIRSAAAAL